MPPQALQQQQQQQQQVLAFGVLHLLSLSSALSWWQLSAWVPPPLLLQVLLQLMLRAPLLQVLLQVLLSARV